MAVREQLPLLGRQARRTKALRQRIRHRRAGEVVVDGLRVIADLVRWGLPLSELYVADSLSTTAEVSALVETATTAWRLPDAVLSSIAPTRHPQGVLAVVAEPQPAPWAPATGPTLFLDRVQDPGNVGAIVRCATALGACSVLLSVGCADPFHPAAVRGAAGAVLQLPLYREMPITAAAAQIVAGGGQVWAAAVDGVPVDDWLPVAPVLLLLGAEGSGVSEPALFTASGQVAVPLERGVESLNVAVAAGILLQELRRPRGPIGEPRTSGPQADR